MGRKSAEDRAAEIQSQAADKANALQSSIWNDQKSMYGQDRAAIEPWRQAGAAALSDLGNADFKRDFTAQDFQTDPGYEFRLREGQKAIERAAAARGGLNSGGTLKAIARYGQDYASGEYQNAYNRFNADRDRRFNRLSSLAGLGQTANSQIGNNSAMWGASGQNYANQVGNNWMGAANAVGAAGIADRQFTVNTLLGLSGLGLGAYSTFRR